MNTYAGVVELLPGLDLRFSSSLDRVFGDGSIMSWLRSAPQRWIGQTTATTQRYIELQRWSRLFQNVAVWNGQAPDVRIEVSLYPDLSTLRADFVDRVPSVRGRPVNSPDDFVATVANQTVPIQLPPHRPGHEALRFDHAVVQLLGEHAESIFQDWWHFVPSLQANPLLRSVGDLAPQLGRFGADRYLAAALAQWSGPHESIEGLWRQRQEFGTSLTVATPARLLVFDDRVQCQASLRWSEITSVNITSARADNRVVEQLTVATGGGTHPVISAMSVRDDPIAQDLLAHIEAQSSTLAAGDADQAALQCPACGASAGLGHAFCAACGAGLGQAGTATAAAPPKRCQSCNQVLPDGAAFCPACGTSTASG